MSNVRFKLYLYAVYMLYYVFGILGDQYDYCYVVLGLMHMAVKCTEAHVASTVLVFQYCRV